MLFDDYPLDSHTCTFQVLAFYNTNHIYFQCKKIQADKYQSLYRPLHQLKEGSANPTPCPRASKLKNLSRSQGKKLCISKNVQMGALILFCQNESVDLYSLGPEMKGYEMVPLIQNMLNL